MPGYVDIHAHMWPAFGIHRSQPFEYLVNLAYGVTTTRDPQTSTTDVLSYEDMVRDRRLHRAAHLLDRPGRLRTQTQIRVLDDAREVLKRYSEFYDTKTIKQYMAGDRRSAPVRSSAASEQHLMPTIEGGLDFKMNLTEAMDGYAGSEHTLPIAPLYKDVLTALRQLRHDLDADADRAVRRPVGGELLVRAQRRRRTTRSSIASRRATSSSARRLRRPGWWAPSQWSFQLFAEAGGKMVAAGGRVGMGSHGQLQGLGEHWEIWNIASGGMPQYDVLRVATIFGAEAIGLEQGPRLARGGQARGPAGARQESARRHQEHEHDPVRDEERPALRRQHARRDLAATKADRAAVVVERAGASWTAKAEIGARH